MPLGYSFFLNLKDIDMKKIFLTLGVVLAFAALTSCSDTSDCVCTYGEETYEYYDWAGSCSDIEFSAKKAEFGNSPVVCTDM